MKKIKILESKGSTYYIKGRGIPEGCNHCLKGAKTVLFLNGICQKPNHCFWYCPISEERKEKSSTFADEIKIYSKEDLLNEINVIDAKGMSITGGEPLFSTKIRGIGLGLAASKNLMEANGGKIEVESEVGKGSTFAVILPTIEKRER